MSAREQFLLDLAQDTDYQQHKKNSVVKEDKYYPFAEAVATNTFYYGTVNATRKTQFDRAHSLQG